MILHYYVLYRDSREAELTQRRLLLWFDCKIWTCYSMLYHTDMVDYMAVDWNRDDVVVV